MINSGKGTDEMFLTNQQMKFSGHTGGISIGLVIHNERVYNGQFLAPYDSDCASGIQMQP